MKEVFLKLMLSLPRFFLGKMERIMTMTEEQLKMIFVSSCIESVAKVLGISSREAYKRMDAIGIIGNYLIPNYELLHTQSRKYVTETTVETLLNWEKAGLTMKMKTK